MRWKSSDYCDCRSNTVISYIYEEFLFRLLRNGFHVNNVDHSDVCSILKTCRLQNIDPILYIRAMSAQFSVQSYFKRKSQIMLIYSVHCSVPLNDEHQLYLFN